MKTTHIHTLILHQQGAALLIMLVIMVVGIAAITTTSLNSISLKISRQNDSSAALAQAKEALIGSAASYPDFPGSLPCPDTDDDGISDAGGGGAECPSYIGRLPWKTLGLPDLRDSSGERLWYTLSNTVRRYDAVHPLNSDTQGTLTITGVQAANKIIAIVFAPGSPLNHQNRSRIALTPCTSTATSPDKGYLCANNYLESTNPQKSSKTSGGQLNTNYEMNTETSTFNDQLLFITHEQLFTPVEMRIAREIKTCLDSYAVTMGGLYPWAVPVTQVYFSGVIDSQFGRIPYQQSDSNVEEFLNALDRLQTVTKSCVVNNKNAATLSSAGDLLEKAAEQLANNQPSSPALSSAVTSPAKQAGEMAQKHNMCDTINRTPSTNSVSSNLNASNAALANVSLDSAQTLSCNSWFRKSNYWTDWKNLVFYQTDKNYAPNGASGSSAITINATGAYRAVVLVARQAWSPAAPARNSSTVDDYLESPNAHAVNNPVTTFENYRAIEAEYRTLSNDLVLCLDGGTGACQ
jgi:hypothetical protein